MQPKTANDKAPIGENTQDTQAPTGKKIAFSQFIKQGGAYECTVRQTLSGIDTTGVTYLSDGMIRGEFSTRIQSMNVDTSFIVRDGFTYSWSSVLPNTGFKVEMVDNTVNGDTTTDTSGSYSWNAEQIGDYDCKPWTVDMAKFTLPSDVTFKEINPK